MWSGCGRCVRPGRNLKSLSKHAIPSATFGAEFASRFFAEPTGDRTLGSDFHFSASPAVTTGFIAFAFDIRKYQ
jgi:hypothetical protein